MAMSNSLLDALRDEDRAQLEPCLSPIEVAAGSVIHAPGEPVAYSYFPCGTASGSYTIRLDSGVSVEIVLVGREGAIGGIVSNGQVASYACATVLYGGTFQRIATHDLEAAKDRSPSLRNLFARYADCLLAQVFQSVACNAAHTVEQRAAKWLIAAIDRTGETDVTMTQEQLGALMGVGRSYTSRLIQRFKADGILRTHRGGIDVTDRDELARRSCSCNALVAKHFSKVLGDVYS